MPNEFRLMHNLHSLEGRGEQAAKTVLDLVEDGRVAIHPLRGVGEIIEHSGRCPVWFPTGSSASIGAVDKRDCVDEARMVLNNTAPNPSDDKPVRVQNHPHEKEPMVPDVQHQNVLGAAGAKHARSAGRRPSTTSSSQIRTTATAPAGRWARS